MPATKDTKERCEDCDYYFWMGEDDSDKRYSNGECHKHAPRPLISDPRNGVVIWPTLHRYTPACCGFVPTDTKG